MEFVEVRGKTVDVAVEAAMQELKVADRSRIDVEVVQHPEKGVLGLFGGKDAIVKVTLKPEERDQKRRRRRRKGGREEGDDQGQRRDSGQGGQQRGQQRSQQGGQRQGGNGRQRQGGQGDRNRGQGGNRPGRGDGDTGRDRREDRSRPQATHEREERTVSIEEQVPVVQGFLTGLVDAFGLEGDVSVVAEDDVIVAAVKGQQTEAMVGPRGVVIEAIHELTKTVLHRQTQSSARLRLDIAGYADRRRQALAIYATQLIDQVLEDGGEVMLEPMTAADRKVIHDAVGAREGVRSYSEGESPQRYVVIAREPVVGASEEE